MFVASIDSSSNDLSCNIDEVKQLFKHENYKRCVEYIDILLYMHTTATDQELCNDNFDIAHANELFSLKKYDECMKFINNIIQYDLTHNDI